MIMRYQGEFLMGVYFRAPDKSNHDDSDNNETNDFDRDNNEGDAQTTEKSENAPKPWEMIWKQ